MKKFFHFVLLLAVASMSMTAFVSCEKDDDEIVKKEEEVKKEDYVAFKYWLSNDVLEVADVKVTGISDLKFNTNLELEGVKGKVCDLVELTGQQAKTADIKVSVELKSNWKELVKDKKEFNCAGIYVIVDEKGRDISFENLKVNLHFFSRDDINGDHLEEGVEMTIPRLGFEYKAGK